MKDHKAEKTENTIKKVNSINLLVCGLLTVVCGFYFVCYTKEPLTIKEKITAYDDLGRKIILTKLPEKIAVISGSIIPVIFELGAGDKIVGVPDNIDISYPEICRRYPYILKKIRIGGFSNPNIEKIISLNPDIVICYESSVNPGKYTEALKKYGICFACFTTVENLSFGFEQINRLGILLGKKSESVKLIGNLKKDINKIVSKIRQNVNSKPLVYYWWGSGNGTYGRKAVINELIELSGGINLAGKFDKQFMELSTEYVVMQNPDVIVISYWKEKDREQKIAEIKNKPGFYQVKAVKNNRVYTIDGNSIHTPVRFPEAIHNLSKFIHPELFEKK